MIYLFIVIYFFFLVWLYLFIISRLKRLSYKHMNDTWIDSLWRGYIIMRRILIIILIVMFFVSSFLILTFFGYDLF